MIDPRLNQYGPRLRKKQRFTATQLKMVALLRKGWPEKTSKYEEGELLDQVMRYLQSDALLPKKDHAKFIGWLE